MTHSPTPTERLALKTANAALLESNDSFCDLVATVVFALGSAQLLQSPETAAELAALRAEVAGLKAERHTTNEVLSDAAEQLRANRDRIAELVTASAKARAMHAKHADSDHCQYDGERWPCQTLTHLQKPDQMAEQKHLMDKLDHVLEALAPHTSEPGPHLFEAEHMGESDAKRRLPRCKECKNPATDPAHAGDDRPEVRHLRALLNARRPAEDPHESPLHREYKDCRDFPTTTIETTGSVL